MALGERIVHELELTESSDTLGKWMGHHLASLLEKAKGQDGERTKAKQDAVDLIIKLWAHKSSLPGSVDPMSTLKGAIKVASRLHPDSSPFYRHSQDKREHDLALLFDGLRRLVAHGLLLIADQKEIPEYVADTFDHLTEEEQQFVTAAGGWIAFFEDTKPKTPTVTFVYHDETDKKKEDEEAAKLEKLDPEERSRVQFSRTIDDLIEQLQSFKEDVLGKE